MPHMNYTGGGESCSSGDCSGGPRIVEYIANGTEDPVGMTVPIGATLAAATYHVTFFGCTTDGATIPWAWVFLDADRTTSTFVAKFMGDDNSLTNGATYKFQIVEAS